MKCDMLTFDKKCGHILDPPMGEDARQRPHDPKCPAVAISRDTY